MTPTNEAGDAKELRRKLAEIYDRVAHWIAQQLEKDVETFHEPLNETAKRILQMRKPRIKKLEPYLTRAAIREYRRSKRKRRGKVVYFHQLSKKDREQVFEVPATTPNPADQAAENEILALAKQEIEKMSELRRDIMRLFFTGLSAKEIGAKLGMKATTVRSNIRHVKEFLAKKFGFAEEFRVARKRLQKPRAGRRAVKRRKGREAA